MNQLAPVALPYQPIWTSANVDLRVSVFELRRKALGTLDDPDL